MTLSDLAEHVFGPYPEWILKQSFPSPNSGKKLPIRDVELYIGDQSIGFDLSEFIINPPTSSPLANNHNSIIFTGIIEVQHLDWLSDKGWEYLQRDIKEHDERIHIKPYSLSIQELHAHWCSTGKHLKVRVGCNKHLLAHYLTTDSDPEKLLIYSKCENIYRTYWVKSLHVSTYQQSKNFLERFRLRALIIELIETDPDGTNLENRTVDWVIQRYYAEIHPRDQSQHHIASEHLGDSIVGQEPRHLRHISHAEIRGWFAKHATWLLAYQIASNSPSSRLLAIPQWVLFCKQAQMDSINAGHKGVKWGQQTEDDALRSTRIYDLPNQLANFGQTVDFWSQKLKNASQRTDKLKTMHYSKQPPQPKPPVAAVPHCQQTFQYDSEFSNATTSESSDSDSELLSYSSQILQTLHTPPAIQTGYFIWHCQLCAHAIDLLSIPVDYLEILPHQIIHILNTKSWNVNDDPVKEALYLMVSHHHKIAHFHAAGLHFSKKGSNFYLEGASSNPQRHKKVKIEEGEQNLN